MNIYLDAVFVPNTYYYRDNDNNLVKASEYEENRDYIVSENGIDTSISLAPPGSTIYIRNTFYVLKELGKNKVNKTDTYKSSSYYILEDEQGLDTGLQILPDEDLVYKPNTYYYIVKGTIEYALDKSPTFTDNRDYYSDSSGTRRVNVIKKPYFINSSFSLSGPFIYNKEYEYYRFYKITGNYIEETSPIFDSTKTYYTWDTTGYYPFESSKYYTKTTNNDTTEYELATTFSPLEKYYKIYMDENQKVVWAIEVPMIESIEEDKKTYKIIKLYDPRLQFSYDRQEEDKLYKYIESEDKFITLKLHDPNGENDKFRGIAYYQKIDDPVENDLIVITKNKFELKSHEWDTNERMGTHFNFSSGAYLEGYGEYISSQTGEIRRPKFILDWRKGHNPIDVNNGVFEVKWNGEVICNNIKAIGGTIGGWTISNNGITKGTISLFSYGDKIGLYAGVNSDESHIMEIVGATVNGVAVPDAIDSKDIPTDSNKYFVLSNDGSIRAHEAEIQKLTAKNLLVENFYLGNVKASWKSKKFLTSDGGVYAPKKTHYHAFRLNVGGTTYYGATDNTKTEFVTSVTSNKDDAASVYYLGK